MRRGLGVFYSLVSFLPVLGYILGTVFAANSVTIVGVTAGLFCVWVVSRAAGFAGFGRMRSTLDLLKENDSSEGGSQDLRSAATFIVVAVWPWVAFALALSLGQMSLAALFALLWLVEFVAYRFLTLRRTKNPIVDHRMEDWLAVVCIPIAALLSAFQIPPGAPPFFGFTLVSPFLLFSGLKSLYDAPKEFAGGLGGETG